MLSRLGLIPNRITGISSTLRCYSSEATLKLEGCFKSFKCELPSPEVQITSAEMINLYKNMFLIRRMEVAADQLYKARLIRGFCHLYNGQEAIATGMESALRSQDCVITAYRDHAHAALRGIPIENILAELLGKSTGCSKGKGGSMHMYSSKQKFFGGNGIVGAQTPIGAGIALANKYLGNDAVTFVYYGDGAANQGQLFESFNMAGLWKLPVVFICENNHYGMGTSTARAHSAPSFYAQADYIPGVWADGMNVLAVRQAANYALDWCRSGKGPLCMEVETYRYVGHSMSDPGTSYRTREEVDSIREKRDPIARCKKDLLENNLATAEDIKTVENDVKKLVDNAIKIAKSAPIPEDSQLFEHIFKEKIPVRGVELSKSFEI